MKFTNIVTSLSLAAAATAGVRRYPMKNHTLPTTTIAGVEVVDTPIVREARKYVEVFNELQPYLYKHVMRTWLKGAAYLNANETLKSQVDLELHAVGTILHDMGWDSTYFLFFSHSISLLVFPLRPANLPEIAAYLRCSQCVQTLPGSAGKSRSLNSSTVYHCASLYFSTE